MKAEEVLSLNSDANIFQIISAIAESVGWIEKTGEVNFGKTRYDYVPEAEFISRLKPLFNQYGLVVYPEKMEYFPPTDGNGNGTVLVTYRFVASKTTSENNSFSVQVIGQGRESDDKGLYKAMTGALKYALRQTFFVPTGDDPEATDEKGNSTAKDTRTFYEKLEDQLSDFGYTMGDLFEKIDNENMTQEKLSSVKNPSKKVKEIIKQAFDELTGE